MNRNEPLGLISSTASPVMTNVGNGTCLARVGLGGLGVLDCQSKPSKSFRDNCEHAFGVMLVLKADYESTA